MASNQLHEFRVIAQILTNLGIGRFVVGKRRRSITAIEVNQVAKVGHHSKVPD
jgi:hypothetical protein